jgi:hypothetical protein
MAHAAMARVRIGSDADAGHRQAVLRDLVLPEVRALPGFMGGTWMDDGQGTATCVLVFEDEAGARSGLEVVTRAGGPPVLEAGIHAVDLDV